MILSYEEESQANPDQLEIITRYRLLEDICANGIYKYLNKRLPEFFDDVNDFPFELTEVYKDPDENPVFLFFMYSGGGSDEMLDFVSQVGEKTFPDDYGLYHKLRGLDPDRLDFALGVRLERIASLRRTNFGMLKRRDDSPGNLADHIVTQ